MDSNPVSAAVLRLLLPIFLGLSLTLSALAYDFSPGEVKEIVEVSEQIVKNFPPEEYFYVGLGRSPTPIMAYLEIFHPNNVRNVPISAMKSRLNDRFGRTDPLSAEAEARLNKHFDRFFGNPADFRGKKIVLIDFVNKGDGLMSTFDYLEKYSQTTNKGYQIELSPIRNILLSDGFLDRLSKREAAISKIIELKPGILSSKFVSQMYDNYAEYGRYDPNNLLHHTDNLIPREGYVWFQAELLKELRATKVKIPCKLFNVLKAILSK